MTKTQYVYACAGILGDCRMVHGEVTASTTVNARKKFRRRYKKRVSTVIAHVTRRAE